MQSHSEGSFHLCSTGKGRLKIPCFLMQTNLPPIGRSLPEAPERTASLSLPPTIVTKSILFGKDVRDADPGSICSIDFPEVLSHAVVPDFGAVPASPISLTFPPTDQ
jgi:hypothetical protein